MENNVLSKQRIQSIDILRGIIMLVMALDHTRDFFHNRSALSDPTDMTTTTPLLFFTRWITHFCAPGFVFLSGISAYIAGTRRNKGQLSAFLIKRGFWLILVEIVLLSFAFSLNPFYNVIAFQVLWAIGVSMIILGLLVRLPVKLIAALGLLIFFGHDLFDYITLPKAGSEFILASLFFTARATIISLGQQHFIFDLYAIMPWAAVMMLGYVFGLVYAPGFDAGKRKQLLRVTGGALFGIFVLLRCINHYGDPAPWTVQRDNTFTLLSFLNVSKYPPSLLYLCMTIGTSLIALSFLEKVQNRVTAVLTTYGNVPFFYYVLHFYLLRLLSVILFFGMGFHTNQIVTPPFNFKPASFGFNLGGVYLIWLFVIVVLYFPCRWFRKYKRTHHQWWLSYL